MHRLKGLLAVLAMAVLPAAYATETFSRTVHFVTDTEKNGGFLIEVTKAAMRRMGYEVTVEFMPWIRALRSVESGEAEALLGTYYTEERAEKMQFTHRIGTSEIVFFKLRNSRISFSRLEDLKPYPIGTIHGAAYTPEFDTAPYLTKEPVPDHVLNIKKLLAGRVPLIVEKRLVVLNTLASMAPETATEVVALDPPLKSAHFFNAFSRKKPGYQLKVNDFNTGLELISRDGTLQRIMENARHE